MANKKGPLYKSVNGENSNKTLTMVDYTNKSYCIERKIDKKNLKKVGKSFKVVQLI